MRRYWALFIPLSISDMVMISSGPILAAGLSRLAHPEVSLAAYGVAESVAILFESPIIMLLHATTALARSRPAFDSIFRHMLVLDAVLTALTFAFGFVDPLYGLLFGTILGLPPDVAAAAHPAFQAMLLWPAAIGWRRVFQGALIRHRRTAPVAWASFGRLATLALVVALGVWRGADGALVAGVALGLSVIVEAALVTVFARPAIAGRWEEEPGRPLPWPEFWSLYWPLASTSILIFAGKPLLSSGLARTHDAAQALALWPVVWTSTLLLANGTRMVQQISITHVVDAESLKSVGRFAWSVAAAFAGSLLLVAWTPLAEVYLKSVVGLPPALVPAAGTTLRILSVLPLAVSVENWLQAHLVRDGRTRPVNVGALLNVGGMVAPLFILARWWPRPGAELAALAVLAGYAVELLWLYRRTRPIVQRFADAPATVSA
ncbi:MAG: hypothetical protein IRZ18_03475 [Clostridia bacterium]|nr:hypothetical protein [Clostridia bacterium]